MMISDRPEATASSTTYWIVGLSTRGSISLGCALVAGRNRVPSPAAGKTALRTLIDDSYPAAPIGGQCCRSNASLMRRRSSCSDGLASLGRDASP